MRLIPSGNLSEYIVSYIVSESYMDDLYSVRIHIDRICHDSVNEIEEFLIGRGYIQRCE